MFLLVYLIRTYLRQIDAALSNPFSTAFMKRQRAGDDGSRKEERGLRPDADATELAAGDEEPIDPRRVADILALQAQRSREQSMYAANQQLILPSTLPQHHTFGYQAEMGQLSTPQQRHSDSPLEAARRHLMATSGFSLSTASPLTQSGDVNFQNTPLRHRQMIPNEIRSLLQQQQQFRQQSSLEAQLAGMYRPPGSSFSGLDSTAFLQECRLQGSQSAATTAEQQRHQMSQAASLYTPHIQRNSMSSAERLYPQQPQATHHLGSWLPQLYGLGSASLATSVFRPDDARQSHAFDNGMQPQGNYPLNRTYPGFLGSNPYGPNPVESSRQTPTALSSKAISNSAEYQRTYIKKQGKPTRPLSAYNIFFKEERQKILQGSPDSADSDGVTDEKPSAKKSKSSKTKRKVGFEDMAKIIAQRWESVKADANQKRYYQDLADQDKHRYQTELAEWKRQRSDELTERREELERTVGEETMEKYLDSIKNNPKAKPPPK
jgi:hypothetical protein